METMTPGELAAITYGILVLVVAAVFGLIYWRNWRLEKKLNEVFEWSPTPVRYPDEHEDLAK